MKDAKAAHSEDWSHLGKLDTGATVSRTSRGLLGGIRNLFRSVTRYERAIWIALGAAGLPSPIVAVLKWGVRLSVAGSVLFVSLPMMTIGLAYALKYGFSVLGVVGVFLAIPYILKNLRHLPESSEELGYGVEKDVYGREKGWFESDSKYM